MCRHLNKRRRLRFCEQILCRRPWAQCHWCGERLAHPLRAAEAGLEPMTLDHVLPASTGAPMGIRNIVPACRRCNTNRSDLPYGVWANRILSGLVAWARP